MGILLICLPCSWLYLQRLEQCWPENHLWKESQYLASQSCCLIPSILHTASTAILHRAPPLLKNASFWLPTVLKDLALLPVWPRCLPPTPNSLHSIYTRPSVLASGTWHFLVPLSGTLFPPALQILARPHDLGFPKGYNPPPKASPTQCHSQLPFHCSRGGTHHCLGFLTDSRFTLVRLSVQL